jgi:CheY-like chemotaxis protein
MLLARRRPPALLQALRAARRRAASILVVDDEPDLRQSIKDLLEAFLGEPRVQLAPNGLAALELLRRQHFDLVITDYKMPGMNGIQFLQQAEEVQPGLRHLLVTAYGREAMREIGAPAQRVVHKPFDPAALVQMVEEALAPASA